MRSYTISFESVAVAAAQDLVQITGAAGKIVRVKRVTADATDTTLPTAQLVAFRCRRLSAAVTNGSGGSTPAIVADDPGDAAASLTALANNTTKATTSGTAVVLMERGGHLYNGLDHPFSKPKPIGPGEAFVFELLSTPSGTVHLSGTVEVEEEGG